MPIKGKGGLQITFECSDLISELEKDIAEFGENFMFEVYLRYYPQYDVEVISNYDFIVAGAPRSPMKPHERSVIMQASVLLEMLKKQNS